MGLHSNGIVFCADLRLTAGNAHGKLNYISVIAVEFSIVIPLTACYRAAESIDSVFNRSMTEHTLSLSLCRSLSFYAHIFVWVGVFVSMFIGVSARDRIPSNILALIHLNTCGSTENGSLERNNNSA